MIFQIDDTYQHYLGNKNACRQENIRKYYKESRLPETTMKAVNKYLLQQLLSEHPTVFSFQNRYLKNNTTHEPIKFRGDDLSVISDKYISAFDALCCQVQEDIAVFQLRGEYDWLAAIHLCAPNHWSPGDKIGRPFDEVHRPVADMEATIRRYPIMLKSIVDKGGPYTRFAWGISTDNRLNHHTEAPLGMDPVYWYGRKAISENDLYVRVERQNLIGIPEVNAFVFTIRTYFYQVIELSGSEKLALASAIGSMTPATIKYKGLDDKKEWLVGLLRS